MEAAELLRRVRQDADLTQAELGRRVDRSQASVASLERPGANPTIRTLEELLEAIGHRLELRAVPYTSSVDETLIARNLSMSPAQRLQAFETAHEEVEKLRAEMRASRP
jgi:transcriptional regulator with XRE-family HTH domain